MNKLNQRISVVEKNAMLAATSKTPMASAIDPPSVESSVPVKLVHESVRTVREIEGSKFTPAEIAVRLAKFKEQDDKNAVFNPLKREKDYENVATTSKSKEVRLEENKKSNRERVFNKGLKTYMGQSNKHLLKHQHYAAVKGEVVLIGTTGKPDLWVPDAELDPEASPIVATYHKRMIVEHFVQNFRTCPEHFLIDHLNIDGLFDATIVDDFMSVSLIIDSLYWNSFTHRVPKTMRGLHITADPAGIRVVDNTGYHTLEMKVRLCIKFHKGVDISKKEFQARYKAVGASLFLRFKMDKQNLLRSFMREPYEPSLPIRFEDEAAMPARIIEHGESVTRTGVILTPITVAESVNAMFEQKAYIESLRSGVEPVETESVPLVPNMLSGIFKSVDDIKEASADIRAASEKGVNVNVDPSMQSLIESFQASINGLTDKVDKMHIDHSVSHSFDMKGTISSLFDTALDKLKVLLPSDPISRDIVICLIIGMIYIWAMKRDDAKRRKYVYIGLALATSVSYWSGNTHVTTYCATLFGGTLMSDLVPLVISLFTEESDDDEDIKLKDNGWFGDLASSISTSYSPQLYVKAMIAAVFGIMINCSPNPIWVMEDIGAIKRIVHGTEMTYEYMADTYITLINHISSPWGTKIFRSCYTTYPEAFAITDKLNELNDRFLTGSRVTKVDYDSKFLPIIDALSVLERKIPRRTDQKVYLDQVNYCNRLVNILKEKFKVLGVLTGGVRAAPYTFTLRSGPGIGKSVLSHAIMDALSPIVLSESEYREYVVDPKSAKVNVNPGEEYQEGVKPGHVMMIIDDFLQMKNKNQDPKICHGNFAIGLVNNAEKVVNKAFGDKGTVFYGPKIVCFNTNVQSLEPDDLSVISINAVARRMGDVFDVTLKPEYRKKTSEISYMLDTSKCDGLDTTPYIMNSASFVVNESNRAEVLKPDITGNFEYHDTVRIIGLRYIDHHVHQEIVLGQLAGTTSNPKLTPWPKMSGIEIAMDLASMVVDQTRVPLRKQPNAVDAVRIATDVKLDAKVAEMIMTIDWRPWLVLLKGRNGEFINSFVPLMTVPFLLSMQDQIDELTKSSDEDLLTELAYWTKKYKGLSADEIRVKRNVIKPKSFTDYFSSAKTKFMGLFSEMKDAEAMYDSNPEFFDHFVENQAKYAEWISGSKLPLQMDANVRILGSRLVNPMENLDIFFFMIRQTFVALSSVARRFCTTLLDVAKSVMAATTWKEFITGPFDVVKKHVTAAAVDMSGFGSDIFNSVAYALPFSGSCVAAVAGVATVVTGLMMSNQLDLVENSISKIKFHPKAVKPKAKAITKVSVVKPVVHVDGTSSDGVPLGNNSRFWNDQVQAVENAAIHNSKTLLYKNHMITQVMFIQDFTFLTNDHSIGKLVDTCDPGTVIGLADSKGRISDVLLGDCEVVTFAPQLDLSLVTTKVSALDGAPHIVKKHVTNAQMKEICKVKDIDALLVYYMQEKDGVRKAYHIPVVINMKFTKYSDKESMMFVYAVEGHPSSCMSPLILCDSRFKNIHGIIGYHTAGNEKSGDKTSAATVVTQELLVEMLTHTSAGKHPEQTVITLKENSEIPSKIPIVEFVPALRQATFNKLQKTPFFDFRGPNTLEKFPSVAVPYTITEEGETSDVIFPLYNKLDTMNSDSPAVSSTIAGFARVMYQCTWDRSVVKHENPSIFSFEDAINGRGLLGPDSRKSSVGYELRTRGITKEMMYGKEGDRDLTTPLMQQLKEEVHHDVYLLKHGREPDWNFLGFTKAELLKWKKISSGLMRYIAGVDWKEHIVCKMLFGYAIDLACRNSIRNGMLMGVNPYSTDIDVMARIMEVFFLLIDMDYKEFDIRFYKWLFEEFNLFCRHVYYNAPEEEHLAREIVLRKLASPTHIVIVKGDDGLPVGAKIKLSSILSSGHTLTQFVGSFGNQIMDRYVYLMKWCESIGTTHLCYDINVHPKPDLEYEEDNIHFFTIGDDVIQCFREERYGHNALSVIASYAEINVIVTPSDKSEQFTKPWKSIHEVSIVKRSFEHDDIIGRWIAMIEEQSILGALYWDENKMKYFDQILDTQLQEAALKGKEYFSSFVYDLRKRATEIEYRLVSPYLDYEVARSFVLNSAYLPWGDTSIEIEDAMFDN
jgi:hypothetical protein